MSFCCLPDFPTESQASKSSDLLQEARDVRKNSKKSADYFIKSLLYTTKEFKTPTAKTKRSHKPRPEKTTRLFSVQPSGEAKTTGTPTTKRKDNATKAKRVN